MKEITLRSGDVCLVDDEDYEQLSQYTWYTTSGTYKSLISNTNSGTMSLHRLLMNCPKDMSVDHRDCNPLNNQKSNLRICTRQENLRNRRPFKNGKSRYKGVTVRRQGKYTYWQSAVNVDKKKVFVKTFPFSPEGEIQAAKAYDVAALKYHGEFAYLNFK